MAIEVVLKIVDLVDCQGTLVPGHDNPQRNVGGTCLESTGTIRHRDRSAEFDIRHSLGWR